MKTLRLISIALILFSRVVRLEADQPTNNFFAAITNFAKTYNVSLRYTTADPSALQQPATLQYVNNRDGSGDSYAIDAALTANFIPNTSPVASYLFFGPTFEYHKNNQISKPQDNLQAGLTGYEMIGDLTERPWATYLQQSLKYKRDKINVGNSLFTKFDVLPLFPAAAAGTAHGPKELKFTWQPLLGIQYEDGSDILKSTHGGSEFRSKLNVQAGLYPWAQTFDMRLEITAAYSYWHGFLKSGQFEKVAGDFKLFKTGIAYYLDPGKHFALGADYLNGQDVETGKPKQETITIALKIKF